MVPLWAVAIGRTLPNRERDKTERTRAKWHVAGGIEREKYLHLIKFSWLEMFRTFRASVAHLAIGFTAMGECVLTSTDEQLNAEFTKSMFWVNQSNQFITVNGILSSNKQQWSEMRKPSLHYIVPLNFRLLLGEVIVHDECWVRTKEQLNEWSNWGRNSLLFSAYGS